MPVYVLDDLVPSISPTAYVHPDATVIGDVVIGDEASVWPTAVLRGDHGRITVGARTSVQDGTVVHTTEHWPTSSVRTAWSGTTPIWRAASWKTAA